MQLPSSKTVKKYFKDFYRDIVTWRPPNTLPSYGFLFVSVFWFAAGLNAALRPENASAIYLRTVEKATDDVLATIRLLGVFEIFLAVLHFAIRDDNNKNVLRAAAVGTGLFALLTFLEEFRAFQHEALGASSMYLIVPFGAISAVFFLWSSKGNKKRRQGDTSAFYILGGLFLAAAALAVIPQFLPDVGVAIGNKATPFANLMIGAYASYFALLVVSHANTRNRVVVYIVGVAVVVISLLFVALKTSVIASGLGLAKLFFGLRLVGSYLEEEGKKRA